MAGGRVVGLNPAAGEVLAQGSTGWTDASSIVVWERAIPAARYESLEMKTNFKTIGVALLAAGICAWSTEARAQASTTTTVTTTKGAFTEFVPGSKTVVVRSETNPNPLRYTLTEQTTIVDESGAPVAIERISPGSPLAVEYATTGDRLVASRIVVQRPATTTAVTTAPATSTTTTSTGTGPVLTERRTTTTTTTTRPLTDDEQDAREDAREDRKERVEERIEKRQEAVENASEAEKERLENLKDNLDDDQ